MTKTIKKGLVACLIAMLAVLVGITASAWGVRAEEPAKPDSNVQAAQNFVKYMSDFDKVEFDDSAAGENGLWKNTADNQRHWDNYYKAKNLIQQITKITLDDLKQDVDGEGLWTKLEAAKVKYQEADKFFGDAYNYVAKILSDMQTIAQDPDFTEAEGDLGFVSRRNRVDELGKQLGLVQGAETAPAEKVKEDWEPFIKHLTNDYEWYYRADAFLKAVDGLFKKIENQISEIYYYDTNSKTMVKRTETNKTTTHIVLSSENYTLGGGLDQKHGVVDAEALVAAMLKEEGQTVEYNVDARSGASEGVQGDYSVEGVKFTREQVKAGVSNYEDMTDARAKIDEYKNMAKEVVENIHEVYDQVDEGKMYYTLRYLIAKYDEDKKVVDGVLFDYNALNDYSDDSAGYTFDPTHEHYAAMDNSGATNYNDLQKLVDDASLTDDTLPEGKVCPDNKKIKHAATKAGNQEGGALFEMLENLKTIDGKITKVETALDELAKAKDTAKYDNEYYQKIKKARDAYDAQNEGTDKLDDDIIGWDLDLYYDRNPEQTPANYKADPDKYGEYFPEFGVKPTKEGEEDKRDYIVKGYADLLAAEAQWDKWTKEVQDLIDKLQELVKKYENDGGEGHPMVRDEYTDIYDAIQALTDEQKEHFKKGTKPESADRKNVTVNKNLFYRVGERGYLKNGANTPGAVMNEFDMIMNKIFEKVDGIIKEITELYDNTIEKGDCVFGSRKTLLDLKAKYEALDEDTKTYVTNYNLLEEMLEEYNKELPLALVWKGLAENLNYPNLADNVKVTVTNWTQIKAAVEAFNALLHGEERLADTLGKLQSAVSRDENQFADEGFGQDGFLTMRQVYEQKYKDLAKEYTDLLAAIKALDTQMSELDAKGNLNISQLDDWNKKFEAAQKAFQDLAKNDVTGEWMSDETNGHKEAYDNYLKAEKLYKRYHVEDLINKLYQQEKFEDKATAGADKGYETDPKKLIDDKLVTLDKAEQINEARKAYDEYLKEMELEDPGDVRNHTKLEAAEAALDMIDKSLSDFMRRVVNLDLSVDAHKNLAKGATYAEIVEALDDIINGDYKGYPLDIYENVEGKDTLPSMLKEYAELTTAVQDVLSEAEATARVAYLVKAKQVLDLMDRRGNKNKPDEEMNIITFLNKSIADIAAKIDAGTELSPEDYELVNTITTIYKELHPSQQAAITDKDALTKVEEAQDTKDAIKSFEGMLEELYKNVVENGEVTNYTQFYLDVLINIYDSFNPSVKDSLTLTVTGQEKPLSFDDVVKAIKAAIKDAIEHEKVLSLHQMQETIEQAGVQSKEDMQVAIDAMKKELAQAFMDAMLTEGDDQIDLTTAIANFKNNIKNYVDNAIKTAIDALRTELNGNIDKAKNELSGHIEGLNEQLGQLTQAQESLEAALKAAIAAGDNELLQALEAQKEALQGNINKLGEKVEAQTKALEDAKADLEAQIKQAQEEGNTALANALATQQAALQGKIDELTAEYEANKAALEAKIDALKDSMVAEIEKGNNEVLKKLAAQKTDLESELNKVKEDLQGAIDAYKDKIAALEQFKTQTEAKLDDAAKESDLTALRNDLLKAMSDLDSKYVTKTEFESKLAEFQKKLDDVNGSLSSIQELKDQIAGVRDEMQKGDKQLQDQIDSMSSSITTLTALLIVIGVLLIAAIVCVVILFLKRNKN